MKLHVLDKCKAHGGPVTITTMSNLDKLSEQELLAEIGYLRATSAPNIRQRRQLKSENGKYKMEKLTVTELLASIKNCIKPEDNLAENLEEILLNTLRKVSSSDIL